MLRAELEDIAAQYQVTVLAVANPKPYETVIRAHGEPSDKKSFEKEVISKWPVGQSVEVV